MLDTSIRDQTEREVSAAFGEVFAEAVVRLPVGEWQGPVSSGYGLHLVKVLRREDPRVPDWREVGGRVISDMEFEAKAATRDQLYQEIAQNYEVVSRSAGTGVSWSPPSDESPIAAAAVLAVLWLIMRARHLRTSPFRHVSM